VAAVISGPADGRAQLRLAGGLLPLHKLRMLCERLASLSDHVGQAALAHEHDDRQLRIPPGPVAEQLVDGLDEALLARPELTLADEEWRMLLPLGLADNKLYYELKNAHSNKEKTFYCMRSRYKLAGNDIGSRPRIRDQSHKELRAAFALLFDWFRICLRQSWLTVPGHTRLNTATAQRRSDSGWLLRVLAARVRHGVLKPAGRYAEAAGLLSPTPDGAGPDPPDFHDSPPSPDDDEYPF